MLTTWVNNLIYAAMGSQMSTIKDILSQQSSSDWCYPLTPYIPFPKEKWPVFENGLISDIHILPDKLQRNLTNDSWYWWCDAQFVPFNDVSLYTTCSVYHPRPGCRWTSVPHMPSGRVVLYNFLSPNSLKCIIFSRTNSSVWPKVNPHPIGQLVAYCGTGETVIMSDKGDPVYSRSRDLTNAVHIYCATANNGVSFACIKRGIGVFFLEYHNIDTSILVHDSIRCHQICQDFVPSKIGNDSVACKFSPNSKQLSVSISTGVLFVVTRSKLEKVCIICPDMLDGSLSSAESFDYDPRFASKVLTVATTDGFIQTVDIETGTILRSVEAEDACDCLTYSPDGLFIAAGFHDFDIVIYDRDLTTLHTFPMSTICQDQLQRVQPHYPTVLHLSFSQNGEHLASTSCDGHLRIWRIPKILTLQEMCRDKILACLPVRKVKYLNGIPEKMKNFLLYKYI
ncbi:unnamed protein product [Lymnaea stagnalis]|uniref:SOCS box domain-containing protein n=1 Tax=Lymnaea stagnalis TaxID=6523 RepID=A0AAV2HYL8_LYMST